jgi:hypothetical protein
VRTLAHRFGEVAVDEFGSEWQTAYYYGRVLRSHGEKVLVQYDDGPFLSHFSQSEIGATPGEVSASTAPAVVHAVDPDGPARRQLVHRECAVVRVGDVDTPTLSSAQAQLQAAAPSKERPLTIVLRRPPPKVRSWRGFARSAAHRRPPAAWDGAVVERFERLLDDPRFARRSNAVYEALKVDFGHATTPDGKTCLMPPLKDVEARMLTAFKRKQQALRDAAQDSAARALAAAAAADVPEDAGDAAEEELIADGKPAPAADGAASDATATAEEGAQPAAPGARDEHTSLVDAHYAALADVGVAVLRQRLRENDEEAQATVNQSALPAGTPPSGPGKSAAVRELLRRRLAGVLARS